MAFGQIDRESIPRPAASAVVPARNPAKKSETPSRSSNDTMLTPEQVQHKLAIKQRLVQSFDTLTGAASDEGRRNDIRELSRQTIVELNLRITSAEADLITNAIIDDILGYGPLEPLLKRDDIADIMVNGPRQVLIEVSGKIEQTNIHFNSDEELRNIISRMVTAVGRRIDESSPICDARLADGSRVNAVIYPVALDGSCLTIRKFRKQKYTLAELVQSGTISRQGADILEILAACRLNIIVSGGTGSGKTTLLNCLTHFIDPGERIVTCEDTAELQLQQYHVVRMETRPKNAEGQGEVTMRDLVKNCLRMRPERIIVGEVRAGEAFDLMQAMNTGHDGSMGTLHANTPRQALDRLISLITMAGTDIPLETIRQMMVGAVNIIVQVARLNDGSRKITHIVELAGMEGNVITTQELMTYEQKGVHQNGSVIGSHVTSGVVKPKSIDQISRFGLADKLSEILAKDPY